MMAPKVTVLMPVYNGEHYLREAIESILNQSFSEFEFLVIDDGSTDHSAEIVASYNDPRIRVLRNGRNLGLIATLNSGIEIAKGEYIARMDCDDVSLPERLEKQVAYLDENPDCAVIATHVMLMDESGAPRGTWSDDAKTATYGEIRSFLPKANCIAHPSVMIRTEILKRYRYNPAQTAAEDYDLWLRLCADGVRIEKITEPLLRYRLNPLSVTSISNRNFTELKQIRSKSLFILGVVRRGRFGLWASRILFHLLGDIWYLCAKLALHYVFGVRWNNNRDMLAVEINKAPFFRTIINAAKMIGYILPAANGSSLFFFFPFFHVGGAERVHASIVACLSEEKPWVVFTKRSMNGAFRPLFERGARLFNLWPFCKYLYPLSVGVMAGFINRHRNPTVFGANSLFYYLMLPYLKPQVRCVDLIHAFGAGVEDYSLYAVERLDTRVVINSKTREELQAQYAAHGIDPSLAERIVLIGNTTTVPEQRPAKPIEGTLTVLYVGRGSEEKRVHLVGKAARLCRERDIDARFVLAGNLQDAVAPSDREFCRFAGEVTDGGKLAALYREAHLLVITSSREGFPLTVMEGMANGAVPVCTAVGGIPVHVRDGVTGHLLADGSEQRIVEELAAAIERLANDRALLAELSQAAFAYAREHFSGEHFCAAYRQIMTGKREQRAPCRR